MVKKLNYTTINNVIESWNYLKRTKDYETVAGTKLFQRLFQECPECKILFDFPIDADIYSPEFISSKAFLSHAAYLLGMIDTALNMLGPDIELLGEILSELGEKHKRFGVKSDMFPVMGVALLYSIQDTLGSQFADNIWDSWKEVYDALSAEMVAAIEK